MLGQNGSAGSVMSISVNYPSPVMVNGYSCKNCTDVDYAKKHIDPAHPKDGPYGVDAKTSGKADAKAGVNAAANTNQSPAVTFGGALSAIANTLAPGTPPSATQGLRLDISA